MTKAERGSRERFVEIAKWIRRICPHDSVRLFYQPPDDVGLENLEDIEVQPVPIDIPLNRGAIPEAFVAGMSNGSPILLLWGPDPIGKSYGSSAESLPLARGFSSHLRLHTIGESPIKRPPLTLIHVDPKPMEPSLNSPIPEEENSVFTGFVTPDRKDTDAIFPIHSRGAEVTANLVKNVLSNRPLSPQAFLYPLIAMIEPTRRCNLACPLCPVGGNRIHQTPDMPLDRFRKVIDELKPFLIRLFLHNYGEPFLHREIYQMIHYAKKEGIPDVEVSTNGHVLDSSRLIDSELDEIKISLDGITQETYANYRRGGRLEKVIENIRGLTREKRKRRSAKPLMELQFIIMRHNQDQMDGFRELATELEADRIRFKTFNVQMSGPEACQVGVEFLPTHPEYTRYQDKGGRLLKMDLEENHCKWPWEWVVINSDGHVVPCCNDFDSHYSMGNAFEGSFHDIWFGPRYNRFREDVLRKRSKIPLCAHCPVPSLDDLSFERGEGVKRYDDGGVKKARTQPNVGDEFGM
jgi:radical SAM protein with 4Fe4S-binding SPASM domain